MVSCCLVSALLLERCRLRCRSISAKLGTAPSRSTAWRLSSQQAHPPSTRTRDSGQGRRLIDRLGTFTRLTRVARLRESASFFASPVGNSTRDVRSHLFSTRSLLTPSETRLSISLVQVFTLLNDSLSVTPKTMVIAVSVEHVRRDLELTTLLLTSSARLSMCWTCHCVPTGTSTSGPGTLVMLRGRRACFTEFLLDLQLWGLGCPFHDVDL